MTEYARSFSGRVPGPSPIEDALRARVAQLEQELAALRQAFDLQAQQHAIEGDIARARHEQMEAELAALKAGHPASEPPEDDRDVLIRLTSGTTIVGYHRGPYWVALDANEMIYDLDITRWWDLPGTEGERK